MMEDSWHVYKNRRRRERQGGRQQREVQPMNQLIQFDLSPFRLALETVAQQIVKSIKHIQSLRLVRVLGLGLFSLKINPRLQFESVKLLQRLLPDSAFQLYDPAFGEEEKSLIQIQKMAQANEAEQGLLVMYHCGKQVYQSALSRLTGEVVLVGNLISGYLERQLQKGITPSRQLSKWQVVSQSALHWAHQQRRQAFDCTYIQRLKRRDIQDK